MFFKPQDSRGTHTRTLSQEGGWVFSIRPDRITGTSDGSSGLLSRRRPQQMAAGSWLGLGVHAVEKRGSAVICTGSHGGTRQCRGRKWVVWRWGRVGGEAGGGDGDFRVRALVCWSGSLGVAVLCMTLYRRMVAFQPQGPLLPVVAH